MITNELNQLIRDTDIKAHIQDHLVDVLARMKISNEREIKSYAIHILHEVRDSLEAFELFSAYKAQTKKYEDLCQQKLNKLIDDFDNDLDKLLDELAREVPAEYLEDATQRVQDLLDAASTRDLDSVDNTTLSDWLEDA